MRKSRAQNAEPAMEHALVRLLLGLILFGVLFYAAMKYLGRFYQEAVEIKDQRITERFLISVRHVHREWLLTGKDRNIKMEYIVDDNVTKKISVIVNKQGWPIAVDKPETRLHCASLWQYFAKIDEQSQLEAPSQEVLVEQEFDECRYMRRNDEGRELLFSYRPLSGEVISNHIKVINI